MSRVKIIIEISIAAELAVELSDGSQIQRYKVTCIYH